MGRKVLIVGSGGREHALALRLLASPSVDEVIACPGNAGMTRLPPDLAHKTLRSVSADPLEVARREGVALVLVGPEAPLVAGLGDQVRALGVPCFGPSRAAAELEGSKAFMKEFCRRHGIRAARDVIVRRPEDLEAALAEFDAPPVVKADGLCAGKGVVVAESIDEARESAAGMLSGQSFGSAGTTVVLEERILGAEASMHAICDGKTALVLPSAQDHKRIGEGDTGPNTGGMGTYAPTPLITPDIAARVQREVHERVVAGMAAEGTPFVGALFAGLMVTPAGEPVVLESNVRFGDPETQVLSMTTDGDFFEALLAAATGALVQGMLRPSAEHALCVVLASAGYPASARSGDVITGVEAAETLEGVRVFHAGTKLDGGRLVTAGGRVLGVTGRGASLAVARDRAYAACDRIEFAGRQLRRDIGYRALGSAS
jgi:phosphoribosylamine--glycine ligase